MRGNLTLEYNCVANRDREIVFDCDLCMLGQGFGQGGGGEGGEGGEEDRDTRFRTLETTYKGREREREQFMKHGRSGDYENNGGSMYPRSHITRLQIPGMAFFSRTF